MPKGEVVAEGLSGARALGTGRARCQGKRGDDLGPKENRAGPRSPRGSRKAGQDLAREQKPQSLIRARAAGGADGAFLALCLSPPAALGFRWQRWPHPPLCAACVLLRSVSTWDQQGSCVPEVLAQSPPGMAKPPGPHQVNGSVPIGGAPAGHCGSARAAALHQLGGLWDLLCEPGASPGDLPDEHEWLPELLGRADGYAMPSFLPTAPPPSWARPPGRWLTPPGVFCREGTSWGSAGSRLPTYVPLSLRCRPEGAGQGACGLQGLPEQRAAGGTICQRAAHLHHPADSLHPQVEPHPAPGTAQGRNSFLTSAPCGPAGAMSCTSPRWW